MLRVYFQIFKKLYMGSWQIKIELCPMVWHSKNVEKKKLKVSVKRILRIVSKHITNVRNVSLKHITKTLNYEVLNCGVKPLNSFSPILCSGLFWAGLKWWLDDAMEPPSP